MVTHNARFYGELTKTTFKLAPKTSYNTSFVYCRELSPGTISLTGGWVRGDDSKQNSYYTCSSECLKT